jgi:hypothetical protein
MVFAPCPRYGRRRVTGSPRTPIFWSVRFVLRFSCPRPQCDGAVCQGRLEAKKAGELRWWPSAPRLFCWKAYTLALTQSGCALHWHALKTATQDAELGGLPGDVGRVDGAEGRAGETRGLGEGVPGWVSDSGQGDFGVGKMLGNGLEDSVEGKTRCVASSARHKVTRSPICRGTAFFDTVYALCLNWMTI